MLVRIIVGTLIALLALAGLYFGGLFYVAMFALVFMLAVYDSRHYIEADGKRTFLVPVYVFAGLFGFVYYFSEHSFAYVAALALLCLTVSVVGQVIASRDNVPAAPYALLPYAYPLIPAVCLIVLRCGFPEEFAMTAASVAVLAPLGGDTLAFFGGRLFGKHRFFPHISPKKTVEGAISGMLGGTIVGLCLYFLQPLWGGPFALWALLLLGLLCGALGQFGDLFASCLKRGAGLKDFSGYIPGHGGTLDRIDSVLLCAPVILAICLLVT
ncbi:MAG: phosphatidate cytidylyltransferase [Clostridiales bacterium]|nr:phosphatidate cytidylyltransferase [Clostridiales bacterium]